MSVVVLEIQKAEFGNFAVPVNNTCVVHVFFVFLAADTLLCVLIFVILCEEEKCEENWIIFSNKYL